ncbi:MAG: hypothetical protein ACLTLQ_10900 [[Clostridium] scindens]
MDTFSVHAQDAYNGKAIYCIEPGIGVKTGDQYTGPGRGFLGQLSVPSEPHHSAQHHQGVSRTDHDLRLAGATPVLRGTATIPDDANEMAGYIATTASCLGNGCPVSVIASLTMWMPMLRGKTTCTNISAAVIPLRARFSASMLPLRARKAPHHAAQLFQRFPGC